MDKSYRCTVCTWRGTYSEASAVRVQPQQLPPQEDEVQRAYEAKQREEEELGGHRPPACPVCGNHTVPVKMHRSHAAI